MDPNDQNPMGPADDQGVPASDQGGQAPDTEPTTPPPAPPAPGHQEPPEQGTGEIAPQPPAEEPQTPVPTEDSQESPGGQSSL